MNKLSVPKGCSRTSKAKTSDIDQEIREMNKRQQEFDCKVQLELSKLNFPINYYKPATNQTIYKRRNHRYKTDAIKGKASATTHRRFHSLTPKPDELTEKPKSPITPSYKFSIENSCFSNIEVLPPLIKSIPMHLDPNLKFAKKRAKTVKNNDHTARIEKMESLIQKCTNEKNASLIGLDFGIRASQQESQEFSHFVSKLVESVKFGTATETLDSMIIFHKDDKKLNKKLKEHSDCIKEELNENTMKFMKGVSLRRGRNNSL